MFLFDYRNTDGKEITLINGDKHELIFIRKIPRGIVARVRGKKPIILWSGNDVNIHKGDSESTLLDRLKYILEN